MTVSYYKVYEPVFRVTCSDCKTTTDFWDPAKATQEWNVHRQLHGEHTILCVETSKDNEGQCFCDIGNPDYPPAVTRMRDF